MKKIFTVVALSLCFLLGGCSFAYQQRPLVVFCFTGHSQRLDYPAIESLFADVSDMLRSAGFNKGGTLPQPQGYYLTGERIYSDGFFMDPSIGCTVEFDRKSVRVCFYEMEMPRKSHVFPATDQQRVAIRVLAVRIQTYLREHLPPSFNIHVSIDKKSPAKAG